MPEIKHNFTGGKMNKDLDERLVSNGEYRDAMNVQVSTSDNSDVGTVQNLLSNYVVQSAVQNSIVGLYNSCIGSVADEKNDALYWFVRQTPTSFSVEDLVYLGEPFLDDVEINGVDTEFYSSGWFNSISTGSSILELKNGQVVPVVKEAGTSIASWVDYSAVSVAVNLGGGASSNIIKYTYQIPVEAITNLDIGTSLVAMHLLQPNQSLSPTTGGYVDFSNGTDYTITYYGPSPPPAVTNVPTQPPTITNVNYITGEFELSYDPDALTSLLTVVNVTAPAIIIALEFANTTNEFYKPPLNFQPEASITGVNIIDNMLFWTDNYNEPKKINIDRCKEGTKQVQGGYTATRLINSRTGIAWADNIALSEEHVTVIRKPPSKAPVLDLKTGRDYSGIDNPIPQVYTGVVTITVDQAPAANDQDDILSTNNSLNPLPYDFSGVNIDDVVEVNIDEDIYGNTAFELIEWEVGSAVVLKEYDELSGVTPNPPPIPITNYRIKADIETITISATNQYIVELRITSIDGFPPGADPIDGERKYAIDLFDTKEKLFEFKFPRFATRYKYNDGEYSTYSPFTQVAFVPGTFDYHPKKGYNLGMTNQLTQIDVKNFRLNDTPLDVVEIDILYKEDASVNIYVVDTIKKDSTETYWENDLYSITHETIKATVQSNQLLRSWDNVPKTALAQEVTGNRIVYGNYTQGWDVYNNQGGPYSPQFKLDIINQDHKLSWEPAQSSSVKSIKSLREYQLGVVFIDEYGRETPVISNTSGTFELTHEESKNSNRIRARFLSQLPTNQKYYKFYIKETSGEYYNLAMDRWFDAADGNVWLAFPSSDRNKLDIDTFLILKKASESNVAVDSKAKYKVLAIENEAPDYVKTKVTKLVTSTHINAATFPIFTANSTINAPISGTDTFEMSFNHFGNSTGSKLHEIDDGDLYVSFTATGSSITSNKYRVVSLTKDEDPLVTNPKYYVKLDKFLEDDVNFITDDATGVNSTEIETGSKINIFKHKVENLPIFDGKFFVKIYMDESFVNYISSAQQAAAGAEWKTIAAKTIYAMRSNHDLTHSVGATGHGDHPTTLSGGETAYGNLFGRFASYFRLYNYGNDEFPGNFTGTVSAAANKYRFHSPSNTPDIETWGTTTASPWYEEFYQYTGFNGDGNFNSANVTPGNGSSYLDNNKRADKLARDNEVWFLDMYQYVGVVSASNNDLNWRLLPSGPINQDNPSDLGTPIDGGSVNGFTNWHHFKLTLGPVYKNKSMGNSYAWNIASSLTYDDSIFDTPLTTNSMYLEELYAVGSGNSNYNDASTVGFTDKLNPGSVWRWKEDPQQTKYNLDQGVVTETNLLRYHSNTDDNVLPGEALLEYTNDKTMRAAQLSTNFNKQWRWVQSHEQKQLDWIPVEVGNQQIGPIDGGKTITLTTSTIADGLPYGNSNADGTADGGDGIASVGIQDFFVYITEASYLAAEDQFGKACRLAPGFVVTNYIHPTGSTSTPLNDGTADPFLVVRKVQTGESADGIPCVKVYLTGYLEALDVAHIITPDDNTDIVFTQGAMNGYSPNSAKRISIQKSTTGLGAFTQTTLPAAPSTNGISENLLFAVGYTMEFIDQFYDNEFLPENPAIWETEPKDTPELDVYYEASDLIPLVLDNKTSPGFLPLKSQSASATGIQIGTFENCTIQTSSNNPNYIIPQGTEIISSQGNKLILNIDLAISTTGGTVAPTYSTSDVVHITKPDGTVFSSRVVSIFSTGVDSVSNNNIYSGLEVFSSTWNFFHTLNWHNCYSFNNGVESNRIRDNFNLPFISNGVRASATLEEKIEKEIRNYGLIFSGIYNSNSSTNNLNQFITAEKITKDINPIYGSIQKLHSRSTADGDLITLCEDRVLKILANKDAVFNADGNPQLTANKNVLGQTIPFAGEYGISKNPESFASESYRAYFTDKQRGAVMRLSKDGLTAISNHGMKDWFRDNLKLSNRLIGSYDEKKDEYNIALKSNDDAYYPYVVSFKEDVKGWVSFKSFVEMESGISMASNYYTFYQGKVYQHHSEQPFFNTFYGAQSPSTITVLLNNNPSIIKSFKTLMYEGSQAKVTQDLNNDGQYYNLQDKKGWHAQNVFTNHQTSIPIEFKNKEDKWFNYIKGSDSNDLNLDMDQFSYQGIGVVNANQLTIITNNN